MSATAIGIFIVAPWVLIAAALPAFGAPRGSGLPVPRFVSLSAGEVNLRTGPGLQYPVDWVFRRSELPVEIVAEYRHWRKIRDWQGAEGWVHQTMLSGRRTAMVTGATGTLRTGPEPTSPAVARVEPSVIARVIECRAGAPVCRVDVRGVAGWIERKSLWGVYADEVVE